MKHRTKLIPVGSVALLLCGLAFTASAAEVDLREQAAKALRKACDFFSTRISAEGGYLWRYSEDLTVREGEGEATATTVWVQPPGTPAVGMAFLRAYESTRDAYYLDLAKKAGDCLVRGQLRSGGWTYRIEFEPKARARYAYRTDPPLEGKKQFNTGTLDDNTTQSALRLLMRLDEILQFKDARFHEAVEYSLNRLLEIQYPIGAWPQRFEAPPDPKKFPVLKASYPAGWSRTFPGDKYYDYYTFNDNAMADTLEVMFLAARIYQQPRYRAAAEKCGGFILLAQMPEPQPAWAQQYDAAMHPAWARKFEPPSVTGGESKGVLQILMKIYQETGNKKYLEPIPRALAYLQKSRLPDGQLARFYELQSNQPLYFTKDYQLTYSDADMPTHYSFKVDGELEKLAAQYQRVSAMEAKELAARREQAQSPRSRPPAGKVKAAIEALDAQGRWVEKGSLKKTKNADQVTRIIDCATFIKNVAVLADYLDR